jgi:hypothetical protein
MVNPRQVIRGILLALLLSVFSAASASLAYGQGDFSLTPSAFKPSSAVDPGGSAIATIDLEPIGGFNSPVSLSCAVTSNQVTSSPPGCLVSPQSQTPPANGPSLTITTTSTTLPGLYTVTVTGTSGALTHSSTLILNVVNVAEDYTLSVSPTTATPSPVIAGTAATTTVTVTPIASYTGQVTLACLSVTPVVTLAPVCSFTPPTVMVTSGIPPTSVMTITTSGPLPTTRLWDRRVFYAFWLAIPGLGLVGVGATGTRRKNLLGALLLVAVASGFLLMPACNSATTLGTNGNTPNNTYVFTLTGTDQNGAVPSNATTDQATVSLAVTTPK